MSECVCGYVCMCTSMPRYVEVRGQPVLYVGPGDYTQVIRQAGCQVHTSPAQSFRKSSPKQGASPSTDGFPV